MLKEIFKKFNILLFLPIIMIICALYFNREKPTFYILEYHPPRIISTKSYDIWQMNKESRHKQAVIIHLANLINYNNNYAYRYEEPEEEELEVIYYNREIEYSDYFTEDQQRRLPLEYTLEDLRLICTMVYGECGAITGNVYATFYDEYNNAINEEVIDASYMHKLTASVLLNRCKHKSFPDTIYANIVKPRQYTEYYTYYSTTNTYCFGTGSNWSNVVDEVLDCLNGNFDVPENVIYQSNFSNLGTSYYISIYVDTGYFRSTSYYAYE